MATSIEAGMVSFLLADTTVAALIGTRIGPWTEQGGAVPRVTYKLIAQQDDYTLPGASCDQPTALFRFACYAVTQLDSRVLADAILNSRGGLAAPNPRFKEVGSNGVIASMGGVTVMCTLQQDLSDHEEAPVDSSGKEIPCVSFDLSIVYNRQ